MHPVLVVTYRIFHLRCCSMWDLRLRHVNLVPWPGSLYWERGVLATGPPGKSQRQLFIFGAILDPQQDWEESRETCQIPTPPPWPTSCTRVEHWVQSTRLHPEATVYVWVHPWRFGFFVEFCGFGRTCNERHVSTTSSSYSVVSCVLFKTRTIASAANGSSSLSLTFFL